MLLTYFAALVAVDVCYGGKIPIYPCEDVKDCSLALISMDIKGYPPLVPEVDKCITYEFKVSNSVSADLVLRTTSKVTLRCPNGTVCNTTESCFEANPQYCISLKDGYCERIVPFLLILEKAIPCEKYLCPGKYRIRITNEGKKFKCRPIITENKVLVMDGSNIAGCFIAKPEMKQC